MVWKLPKHWQAWFCNLGKLPQWSKLVRTWGQGVGTEQAVALDWEDSQKDSASQAATGTGAGINSPSMETSASWPPAQPKMGSTTVPSPCVTRPLHA
eukprot:3190684-Amphidinium_carterae.3